jgi:hypothetical protein
MTALAGEMPIGPAPCDPATQQCMATEPLSPTAAVNTGDQADEDQSTTDDASTGLTLELFGLLLNLLS